MYTYLHPIAQMDETKSLAFRALEELLRAQKTQSRLRRQFVMAQLKETAVAKREEITKREVHLLSHGHIL